MDEEKYEVFIRDTSGATSRDVWTMTWMATTFAQAEELTNIMLESTKVDSYSEIVKIKKWHEDV